MNEQMDNLGVESASPKVIDFQSTSVYRYTLLGLIGILSILISINVLPFSGAIQRVANQFRSLESIVGMFRLSLIFDLIYCIFTNQLIVILIGAAFSVWAIAAMKKGNKSALLPVTFLLAYLLLVVVLNAAFYIKIAITVDGFIEAFVSNGRYYVMYFTQYLLLSGIALGLFVALRKYFSGNVKATAPAKSQVSGFGGWLVICSIRLIVSSFGFVLIFVYAIYNNILNYFAFHRPEMLRRMVPSRLLSQMGQYTDYAYILLAFLVAFGAVVGIMTVIKLFKKESGFKEYAVTYEAINVFMALFSLLNSLVFGGERLQNTAWVGSTIFMQLLVAVIAVLFIVYYAKSDRVKNTFVG